MDSEIKKCKKINRILNNFNNGIAKLKNVSNDYKNIQYNLINEIIENGLSIINLYDKKNFAPTYGEICIHDKVQSINNSDNIPFIFDNNYSLDNYILHIYLTMIKKTNEIAISAPIICKNIAIELIYNDIAEQFEIDFGLFDSFSIYYGAIEKIKKKLSIDQWKLPFKKIKTRLCLLGYNSRICYNGIIYLSMMYIGEKIIISDVFDLKNRLKSIMRSNSPIEHKYFLIIGSCNTVDLQAPNIVKESVC